jgi:hypothetical protein
MLRIFCRLLLRKPASLVKRTRMLKQGSSPCCRRNQWENFWRGRKSGGLGEFVPVTQQLFTQNSPNCHTRHMFACSTRRTLVRRFHLTRPTQTVRAIYRRSGNSTGPPDVTSMVGNVRGSASPRRRHVCPYITSKLLHRYHGLRRELNACLRILEMCNYPF